MLFNNCFASEVDLSIEQKSIVSDSYKNPEFLISEKLKYIYPKSFIKTDLSTLNLNISLSNFKRNDIFKNKFSDIELDSSTYYYKKLFSDYAFSEKIKAINNAYLGFYNAAIQHFEKAKLAYVILSNEKVRSIISENLTELYWIQGELEKAKENNQVALDYYSENNNQVLLFNSLLKSAKINIALGNTSRAEQTILKQCLPRKKTKKQEEKCYYILGKTYLKSKQYVQAKWFFIQADELANKINDIQGSIDALLLLAKVKHILGDRNLAIADLNKVKYLIRKYHLKRNPDLDLALKNY